MKHYTWHSETSRHNNDHYVSCALINALQDYQKITFHWLLLYLSLLQLYIRHIIFHTDVIYKTTYASWRHLVNYLQIHDIYLYRILNQYLNTQLGICKRLKRVNKTTYYQPTNIGNINAEQYEKLNYTFHIIKASDENYLVHIGWRQLGVF